MSKQTRKGVQGRRIKILPDKEEGMMLSVDLLVQRGKVIAAGKKSICKTGDVVIVSDWLVEKIRIGDEVIYYVNDEAILEIL